MLKKLQETELTYGELLSSSWQLYKHNLGKLLKIILFLQLPIVILYYVVIFLIGGTLSVTGVSGVLLSIALILVSIIFFILLMAASVAPIKLYTNSVEEKDTSIFQLLEAGLRKLLPFLTTSIIAISIFVPWLVIMIGVGLLDASIIQVILILLSIIPLLFTLYFALFFVFIPHRIVAENEANFTALARSRKLIKGRWLKTFAYLLITSILVSFATFLIYLVVSFCLITLTAGSLAAGSIFSGDTALLLTSGAGIITAIIWFVISTVISIIGYFNLSFITTMYYNWKYTAIE